MNAIVPGTLRPTDANQWANCAYSFALQQQYPDDEQTPARREGVAADWLAMLVVENTIVEGGQHPTAPNGVPIDQDMIDAARVLADDVERALAAASPQASLRVQTPVTMKRNVHLHNEGRPDVFLIDMVRRQVIVWEYKYGHRYVDPYDNLPMIDYLAGIFEAYDLSEDDLKGVAISVRVVQPRNYQISEPVRIWDTTPTIIFARIRWLAQRAALAKSTTAIATTGPWCGDCSGRTHCSLYLKLVGGVIDIAGESVPHDMTPEVMGVFLTQLEAAGDRLDAMRDGLRAAVMASIKAGAPIRGWGIERRTTRAVWTAPAAEVAALGDMMGLDLRKPTECITPAQALKLGLDAALVDPYSTRYPGDPKLAPVAVNAAAKTFTPKEP